MRRIVFGIWLVVGMEAAGAQAGAQTGVQTGVQAGPMAEHTHKPAESSTSLTVTANGKSLSFSAADLQAMPQHTVTVHNGHSNADEQYSGVAVSDLLGKFNVSLLNDGAKKVYHSYLRATGTDGYYVLYSTSEVEAGMHAGDVIVATMQDGKPLGADGQFKLVSSEDKRPARWVRNLNALTLVDVE